MDGRFILYRLLQLVEHTRDKDMERKNNKALTQGLNRTHKYNLWLCIFFCIPNKREKEQSATKRYHGLRCGIQKIRRPD